MNARTWCCIAVLAVSASLPSCSATYQQMLHEKDLQISQLENANAQLRAANRELERKEQSSRDRVAGLETQLASRGTAQDASASEKELKQVREELGDLDVGYRRGRISIGIENSVAFASGSTDIVSGGQAVLKRVADVMRKRYADRRIYVEGHTDTDPINKTKGKFRSNTHLSCERADAVASYLIDKCSLPAERVVVVGYGPYDPKVDGATESAKAKNRRVEIVVGDPM
jgi:chemotaxis protein MotB